MEYRLSVLGQPNAHESSLFNLLTMKPNFQRKKDVNTLQTAVMNANTGYYYEVIWE